MIVQIEIEGGSILRIPDGPALDAFLVTAKVLTPDGWRDLDETEMTTLGKHE